MKGPEVLRNLRETAQRGCVKEAPVGLRKEKKTQGKPFYPGAYLKPRGSKGTLLEARIKGVNLCVFADPREIPAQGEA